MQRVKLFLTILGLSSVQAFATNTLCNAKRHCWAARVLLPANIINIKEAADSLVPASEKNYCSTGGQSTRQEYLQEVWMGAINNHSGDDQGYGDFTDQLTPLTRMGNVTGYLKAYLANSREKRYYNIWIDYNHNNHFFDSGELVASVASFTTGYTHFQFTVPADAMLGETRLRISMSTSPDTDPCETFARGETEDYTVIIGLACMRTAIARPQVKNNASSGISIAPNPVTDILHIRSIRDNSTAQLIEIFDVNGTKKMMLHNAGSSVNVSALQPGTYIIRIIQNSKTIFTGRFVKQ